MKLSVRLLLALTLLLGLLAGCQQAPAPTSTSAPDSSAQLEISGAVAQPATWTEADLRALGPQEVDYTNKDGETTTYTGVLFETLLAEAQVEEAATTLIFRASDGYEAQVPLEEIRSCADCAVGLQDQGGFRVVLPDFPSNVQVKDLVAIEVLDAEAAMPQAPETDEEALPADDTPVTVTDAAGRTVTLEGRPRRIVVVGRAPYMGLHLLYMFPEGRERLIGAESRGATPSDFLPYVDPDFNEIATMAANPNPEQIASLEPDVVLMKSVVVEQMGESLAQVDIPVVYLGLETPEQFFQDVRNVGALLGNEARAQEILDFYQRRLEQIRETVAEIPEEEQPRVLLVEYTDRGGEVAVKVPAPPWMQTVQVQTAGGRPVWVESTQVTDGWTVVNFEQIAAWDPDKIFVVVWYQLDPQEVIDGLKADPQWSKLGAVEEGELYAFPADIFGWDTPESRWILGMTWLAKRLHPERFEEVDLEATVYAFFEELYGMDEAAVDEHIMPRLFLDVR